MLDASYNLLGACEGIVKCQIIVNEQYNAQFLHFQHHTLPNHFYVVRSFHPIAEKIHSHAFTKMPYVGQFLLQSEEQLGLCNVSEIPSYKNETNTLLVKLVNGPISLSPPTHQYDSSIKLDKRNIFRWA